MRHLLTADRGAVPSRFYGEMPREREQRPSLEQLKRDLEVLRSKFHTLKMAHDRIEREMQTITQFIEEMQGGNRPVAVAEARPRHMQRSMQ